MDFSELKELIRILEDSGLSEIEVEEDGRRIRLQKPQPYATAFPFAAPQTISPNGPPEPALPAQVEEPDGILEPLECRDAEVGEQEVFAGHQMTQAVGDDDLAWLSAGAQPRG